MHRQPREPAIRGRSLVDLPVRPRLHGSPHAVVALLVGGAALALGACSAPAGDAGPDSLRTAGTRTSEAEGPALPTPTSVAAASYPEGSVLHVLRDDDRFSILVGLVEQRRPGSAMQVFTRPTHAVTFFVPTDDAFMKADPSLVRLVAEDNRALLRLIYNHVVPGGSRSVGEIATMDRLLTLGTSLEVGYEERDQDETLTVAGVPIAQPDVVAGSTIIHVVDDLLLPCGDPVLRDLLHSYPDLCDG